MAFNWNRFAYTNFHELNLDWFNEHFKEIFEEWEELYNTLTQWKEDTDADLAQWKEDTLAEMDTWERELLAALDEWKTDTGNDISDWEAEVISDLNGWKETFLAAYESLEDRVEAIVSDTEDMVENLAHPFSSSTAYSAGDYVIYNGVLYAFTANHAAGAWTGTDVSQTVAMDDIAEYKNPPIAMLGYGGPDIASAFYLEEGDNSGATLWFKLNRSNIAIHRNGTTITKPYTTICSDLNVTPTNSTKGVSNCIEVPNNNALVFDPTDNKMKFVVRTAIKEPMIPFFFNSYGRAEYPNKLFTEYKNFLIPFVNVKQFGARGVGSVDDTQAFQDALNYLHSKNGGTLYVPGGTYLINTTLWNSDDSNISAALHIYSNTKILMDKNAILKRSAQVNHLLCTHNESTASGYTGVSDIEIEGGIIDDNSAIASSSTPLNISHANNIYIHNVTFQNAHNSNSWHFIEVNSSKNVKIENCHFVNGGGKSEDIQIDAANGAGNLGTSDGTVCIDIDIEGCYFENGAHPAIGNHSNAAHKNIRIHNNIIKNTTNTNGAISFTSSVTAVDVHDCTIYNNASGLKIAATQNSCIIRDCRLESVTNAAVNCIAHNNMINGVWTA